MGYNFVPVDRGQGFLLPPDVRDWLPPTHLAWQIMGVVDGFDLSGFLVRYRADGQGRAAYHPAVMVGLLLYCHCKGIRSSRAVELACHDDLGARVITGNRQPDHATIARFVAANRAAVTQLFIQVLAACARDGLLSVDVVAGDGTKIRANASMAANATLEQLEIQVGELEALIAAQVQEWMAQADAADAAEDLFDEGEDTPGGRPTPLQRTVDKLARRQAALGRLQAERADRQAAATAARQAVIDREQQRVAARRAGLQRLRAEQQERLQDYQRRRAERLASGGRGADGRVPVPVEDHAHVRAAAAALANAETRLATATTTPPQTPDPPQRINTTDPTSRVMIGKRGETIQAHNVQIVAGKRQLILAIATHHNPSDVAALHPMLNLTRDNLDRAGITDPIQAALWDAGYACEANFNAESEPTTLYVAVTKEARQTGRAPRTAKKHKKRAAMAARLDTNHGRRLYRQRAALVEPVFGQIFQRFGRYLNHRGAAVDTELHLLGTCHNILKLGCLLPSGLWTK